MLVTQGRPLVFVERIQPNIIQIDATRRCPVQPGAQTQKGRFAATRWANNGERIAGFEGEVDTMQNGQVAAPARIGFRQIFDAKNTHKKQFKRKGRKGSRKVRKIILAYFAYSMCLCV